ncbi:MAG TPA: 50S ribosomal L9 C-terminal domain-containing protein, partial [Anaerolineales bacterium]
EKANVQRAIVNQEMDAIAKQITGLSLVFPARASETGKLYGSITTQMIADAIKAKSGVEVARRQIDSQPLRMLGEYKVRIRLTVDLIPSIDVIVHREGEAPTAPTATKAVAKEKPEKVVEAEPVEEPVEEPAEEPVEEPVEEPAEQPAEEPVEEPVEEPAEEPVEEPTEESTEEPAAE